MKYLAVLFLACCGSLAFAQQDNRGNLFVSGLDSIRAQLKIPGMAAIVKEGNTILLEQGFGYADLFMSPVGQLFYRCFVLNGKEPAKDFQNKELIDRATMALVHGDTTEAQNLYAVYAKNNVIKGNDVPSGTMIAGIREVTINKNLSRPFNLSKATRIRVFGVGEDCSGDGSSWCDYGWIEDSSGKVIWQMQGQPAVQAGGAWKNKKVDQEITLPAGKYILRYKSDFDHAYNSWDSLPPDHFFWGIILLALCLPFA